MNVVIMAGGGGTRLWPLSRRSNPKQFLDLGTGKTLLRHTFERAETLAKADHIFIATVAEYADRVRELVPEVPADHVFLEPARRDTGPAFAAAAVELQLRNLSEEPTIFMWADHVFTDEEEFLSDLAKIPQLVTQFPESVVIVGHTPTSPETGLGYLEVGEPVAGFPDVFRVAAFKEKPDLETAKKYVTAGNYYWNMAYISLRPQFLLAQLEQHAPDLASGIAKFRQARGRGDIQEAAAIYGALPKISIDYALLEKTSSIIAVTGDYGWSDVGNWGAVQEIFGVRGDHAPRGHHIHVDSENNYVYNATEHAVSLIGVKDTIVVVTEDAILVSHKADSHKVKEVVARLEAEGKETHL